MESRRLDWWPAPGQPRHARPRQGWFARSVTSSVARQAQCELGAVEGRPEIGSAQRDAERGARLNSGFRWLRRLAHEIARHQQRYRQKHQYDCWKWSGVIAHGRHSQAAAWMST